MNGVTGGDSSGLMQRLKNVAKRILFFRGQELVPSDGVYEWQRRGAAGPGRLDAPLSPDARAYLKSDNPKLLDLERRYAAFNSAVTTPLLWRVGHLRDEEIPSFRGDNAYVWQVRGMNSNVLGYGLTYYFLKSIDRLDLLGRMAEDGAFGCFSFEVGGSHVSRDLLDSIAEIYFLERHLQISEKSDFRILDIGAGYGRLAYRATSAWPGLGGYLCTDAVASSTFLSDFYLKYRGLGDGKARAVPLDEIEATVASGRIDLAVNIHSFSECQPATIDWWTGLIARNGVKHLMIVPNHTDSTGRQVLLNDKTPFTSILEKHGYRLVASEPKYGDPVVQRYGIFPAQHFLFELNPR